MKELMERPQNEVEEWHNAEQNAINIEEFILDYLLNQWIEAKKKFVKAYHFWKVVLVEAPFSKFTALQTFMTIYYKKLWESILLAAESGDTKFFIKIPKEEMLDKPTLPGSSMPDRRIIDFEVKEALKMLELIVHLQSSRKQSERGLNLLTNCNSMYFPLTAGFWRFNIYLIIFCQSFHLLALCVWFLFLLQTHKP